MYRWKAYNYLDIKETFIQLGFEVDEIRQHLEHYDVNEEFADVLRAKIKSSSYAFVFTVNYFPVISDVCQELGLPYVIWTCDNPLISMYHQSVFNDVNRIFTFDRSNLLEFQQMGVKNIWYMPLAVDAGRIQHILSVSSDAELRPYRNEAAFVGSLYEKNSYDRIRPQLSEYLQGYFDSALAIQSTLFGGNILERCLTVDIQAELGKYLELQKSDDSFSNIGLIFSVTTLGFKAAQLQRKKALLELSKHMQTSIYSNSDTSDLATVDYRGSVEYWTQMPKVFNQTRINLNFTIPNIITGIPLRIWDALGSGGFLLTNFQSELPQYFKNDTDLVWFLSIEEMADKAQYYLSHDTEREKIAAAGLENVMKNHTYISRIQRILELI